MNEIVVSRRKILDDLSSDYETFPRFNEDRVKEQVLPTAASAPLMSSIYQTSSGKCCQYPGISLISVHPLKQDRTSMDRVAQSYFLFNRICVPLLWWRNICDDFMFSQCVWPFFHPHSCVKSGESHPAEQNCGWSPSGCPEPNDEQLSRSAVWSLSLTWCNATQRFSAAVLPPGSTLAAPQ